MQAVSAINFVKIEEFSFSDTVLARNDDTQTLQSTRSGVYVADGRQKYAMDD